MRVTLPVVIALAGFAAAQTQTTTAGSSTTSCAAQEYDLLIHFIVSMILTLDIVLLILAWVHYNLRSRLAGQLIGSVSVMLKLNL